MCVFAGDMHIKSRKPSTEPALSVVSVFCPFAFQCTTPTLQKITAVAKKPESAAAASAAGGETAAAAAANSKTGTTSKNPSRSSSPTAANAAGTIKLKLVLGGGGGSNQAATAVGGAEAGQTIGDSSSHGAGGVRASDSEQRQERRRQREEVLAAQVSQSANPVDQMPVGAGGRPRYTSCDTSVNTTGFFFRLRSCTAVALQGFAVRNGMIALFRLLCLMCVWWCCLSPPPRSGL